MVFRSVLNECLSGGHLRAWILVYILLNAVKVFKQRYFQIFFLRLLQEIGLATWVLSSWLLKTFFKLLLLMSKIYRLLFLDYLLKCLIIVLNIFILTRNFWVLIENIKFWFSLRILVRIRIIRHFFKLEVDRYLWLLIFIL
jgi:hypothetical protein